MMGLTAEFAMASQKKARKTCWECGWRRGPIRAEYLLLCGPMRADLGGEVCVVVVDEVCVVGEPAQPEHDQHHDEHHAHLQQQHYSSVWSCVPRNKRRGPETPFYNVY